MGKMALGMRLFNWHFPRQSSDLFIGTLQQFLASVNKDQRRYFVGAQVSGWGAATGDGEVTAAGAPRGLVWTSVTGSFANIHLRLSSRRPNLACDAIGPEYTITANYPVCHGSAIKLSLPPFLCLCRRCRAAN